MSEENGEKTTLEYARPTPPPDDWAILKFVGGFLGAAGSTVVAMLAITFTPSSRLDAIGRGASYFALLAVAAWTAQRSEKYRPLGAGIWCAIAACLLLVAICVASNALV